MVLYKYNSRLLFQIVFFIVATIEILLLSGITYGWASIVHIFKREGFFHYLCNNGNNQITVAKNITANSSFHDSGSKTDHLIAITCSRQNRMFNLIFVISLAFLCTTKLPIGVFIDTFGPRAGQLFGSCLYLIAGFGLAFATKETSGLLFPIFILFCIGGGFIAVAKYQMCRYIYTDVRSLVLSILHGTFDSSAVILLFFKLAWESGFKLRDISLFYILFSISIIALSLVFLTPPYSMLLEKWPGNEKTTQLESVENINDEAPLGKMFILKEKSPPDSFFWTIFSPGYLLELMFLAFCQLRLWFFIGSLNELIAMRFPSEDHASINAYNTYFGYAQLCGILVGPMIGCIFDRNSIRCKGVQYPIEKESLINKNPYCRINKIQESALPFFLTNFLCLGFSILSLTPWKSALIPSFVFHVLSRGFLYSAHASYIAMAFQPQRFATLYGLGIFASGVFGLLEYPLYNVVYYFESDPFWVNLALLFLVLSANIFPLYLLRYCKKIKEKLNARSVLSQNI